MLPPLSLPFARILLFGVCHLVCCQGFTMSQSAAEHSWTTVCWLLATATRTAKIIGL